MNLLKLFETKAASKYQHPSDRLVTTGFNVSDVTVEVLDKLLTIGSDVPSRNGNTKELNPHTIVIQDGGSPYTLIPYRNNNVIATVAETLWVWAGRNDVGSLSKWLPRAPDYSDDFNLNTKDGTWRAGYGPRIRNWQKRDGSMLDQLEVVVSRLQKSLETRQALFTLYDPDADSILASKDYPCNLLVHFIVRNGELNMHTYVRSNDVVFGFCINSFEWMFVWDYVADKLKLPKGNYYHNVTSLHLYEPFYEKTRKMVNAYTPAPTFPYSAAKLGDLSPRELTLACNAVYEQASTKIPDEGEVPTRLRDFAIAIYSENALASRDWGVFITFMSEIRDLNLALAMLELGQRRAKEPLWNNRLLTTVFPVENDFIAASSYLKGMWSTLEISK